MIHQAQNTIDEGFALTITQLPQCDVAAQMRRIIGIASGTAERTFLCNLDGERGLLAPKYLAPRLNDLRL